MTGSPLSQPGTGQRRHHAKVSHARSDARPNHKGNPGPSLRPRCATAFAALDPPSVQRHSEPPQCARCPLQHTDDNLVGLLSTMRFPLMPM
jgi:hypothetical protein